MNEYTVVPSKNIWHVNKDGKYFCTASSEELAQKICASLQGGPTSSGGEFTLDEMINLQELNDTYREARRRVQEPRGSID